MGKVVFNVVLPTQTRMFCGCPVPVVNEDGLYETDGCTCPVCRGEKGAYPILNKKAVEEAVALVLALNGKVTQYTLFDRVKGEGGLYDSISQYSYPIGNDGYVEYVLLKDIVIDGDESDESDEDEMEIGDGRINHIDILKMRLKESEEEKGIPVLEIVSGPMEEEQNPYYIEAIESILNALGMEEWEIIETDDLIETMESRKPVSYLPDPDLPPVIISQWWIDQIAAKYPELIHIEEPEVDEDDF